MASKLVLRGEGASREWPLEGTRLTLGRDPGNDIVVDDEDRSVSRFHARLELAADGWQIVDTHSRNRVTVNGQRIAPGESGARRLSDGDTIALGACRLRFVRDESERVVLEPAAPGDDDTSRTRSLTFRPQDLVGLIDPPQGAVVVRDANAALERAKTALAVLTSIGRRIAAAAPEDDIIDALVELVFVATPAERAALFLWDDDAARLVPKRGRTRAEGEIVLSVSESLVREAFAEKTVVQMDPAGGLSQSMLRLGLRSAIAAPLLDVERAVGVVYADTPLASGAFDPFAVALLSSLASHAAIALQQARLLRQARDEERKRVKLERYLARGVVDRVLASGESSPGLSMTAEEADATVVFCDMAGFTARAEEMAPRDVLLLLNRCFSHMTEVVHDFGGSVDKYIGDCLMAVFGAPIAQADHARRAALAALGLRDAIARINAAEPGAQVGFRIGMHSGRVIAGDVGHVTRRDWTVLGSTVNLASRIQSFVARPGQIVLTGETRDGLGSEFELRPVAVEQPLKGIKRELHAFELVGVRHG